MNLDLNELVQHLRRNDNTCLKTIFLEHGNYCTKNLIKRTSCSPEDADDIFVDAIINFRERLLSGKVEYLTNIRGYLYSTCYNMWLVKHRKSKIHDSHAEDIKRFYQDNNSSTDQNREELHAIAQRAISSLGDKCQYIIKLFYFNKLTMAEIAEEMGFASSGVAKTIKARCYKKLMEKARQQMTQNQVYLSND